MNADECNPIYRKLIISVLAAYGGGPTSGYTLERYAHDHDGALWLAVGWLLAEGSVVLAEGRDSAIGNPRSWHFVLSEGARLAARADAINIVATLQRFDLADMLVRVQDALTFAERFGQIDGSHHRLWVINQMMRALLGDRAYTAFVERSESWETGIAP